MPRKSTTRHDRPTTRPSKRYASYVDNNQGIILRSKRNEEERLQNEAGSRLQPLQHHRPAASGGQGQGAGDHPGVHRRAAIHRTARTLQAIENADTRRMRIPRCSRPRPGYCLAATFSTHCARLARTRDKVMKWTRLIALFVVATMLVTPEYTPSRAERNLASPSRSARYTPTPSQFPTT